MAELRVSSLAAVNPLTLPPRLLLRALDDLHAIAEAARRLPAIEATLIDRFELLDARAEEVLAAMGKMLALGERIAERGAELVAFGRGDDFLGRLRVTDYRLVRHARRAAFGDGAGEGVGDGDGDGGADGEGDGDGDGEGEGDGDGAGAAAPVSSGSMSPTLESAECWSSPTP